MSDEPFSVGIIGGGLAGLSAAAALVRQGVRVELFESRPRLGGRTGAFWEPTVCGWIDFGPHVLMGCCTQMLRFCQATGMEPFLRRYTQVHFLHAQGDVYPLQAHPLLPAPFHLLPSFLRLGFLSWQDRLNILWALGQLLREAHPSDEFHFHDWLKQRRQTDSALQQFWTPMVLSALADLPERVAFSVARKVFVEGLLQTRNAYHIIRPSVAWGQLLEDQVGHWLAQQGACIHRRTPIQALHGNPREVQGVVLKDGTAKRFDFYILAVPWRQATALLPPAIQEAIPPLAHLRRWEPGAITTWHVWLDRPLTELPQTAVVGKAIQWLFSDPEQNLCLAPSEGEEKAGPANNPITSHPLADAQKGIKPGGTEQRARAFAAKSKPFQTDSPPPKGGPSLRGNSSSAPFPKGDRSYHYQVVISGTHVLPPSSLPQTREEVLRELGEIFPAVKEAHLVAIRRITMPEAVFSPRAGIEHLRPNQETPLKNFALAGDWTATGWPATMESAVRSGTKAAEIALDRLGIL